MPTQTSFSEREYAAKKKLTRRDRFLVEIEAATPWAQLVAVIEPYYPKDGRGRPPIGPERMLRVETQVGVDAESGLMHTVVGTAANVSDVTQAHALLHGEETDVFADAGYRGVDNAHFLPKMTASEPQIAPSRCNPCAPQCMRGLDGHLFSGSLLNWLPESSFNLVCLPAPVRFPNPESNPRPSRRPKAHPFTLIPGTCPLSLRRLVPSITA